MNVTRLTTLLMIAVAGGALALPASARPRDTPTFGVWLAQWAQRGNAGSGERLPCRSVDKANCNNAFPTTLSALASPAHGSALTSGHTRRHKVSFARVHRYTPPTTTLPTAHGSAAGALAGGATLMLFNGRDGRPLTLEDHRQPGNGTVELQSLDEFVTHGDTPQPGDGAVVTDVAAGVGNNAYAALYDFEDEGAVSENARSFPEISSLSGAQTLLASAADVPEPATLVLIGAGLLVLRTTARGRHRAGALRPGAL